jgi:hypothetical protein
LVGYLGALLSNDEMEFEDYVINLDDQSNGGIALMESRNPYRYTQFVYKAYYNWELLADSKQIRIMRGRTGDLGSVWHNGRGLWTMDRSFYTYVIHTRGLGVALMLRDHDVQEQEGDIRGLHYIDLPDGQEYIEEHLVAGSEVMTYHNYVVLIELLLLYNKRVVFRKFLKILDRQDFLYAFDVEGD